MESGNGQITDTMKKTILPLIFLMAASLTQAQVNRQDSLVNIVPYFGKNDTMTYWYIDREYKITHSDTMRTLSVARKFMIRVRNVSKSGYKLDYTTLEVEYDSTQTDFKGRMKAMTARMLKDITVKLAVDQWGELQQVENWKEIRKKIGDSPGDLFAEMYREMPGLDSLLSRDRMERLLRLSYSTEAGILNTFADIGQFFSWYSMSFPLDRQISETDEGGGDAYPSITRMRATADEEDNYSLSVEMEQTIPDEAVKALTGSAVELVANENSVQQLNNELQKQQFGTAKVTDVVSNSYFYDGWPQRLINRRTVELPAAKQGKVVLQVIDWDTRSVGNE